MAAATRPSWNTLERSGTLWSALKRSGNVFWQIAPIYYDKPAEWRLSGEAGSRCDQAITELIGIYLESKF